MKKLNHWLRNFFGFSKTESNGFIILIPLIFIIVISPYVLRYHYADQVHLDVDHMALDSLISRLELKQEVIELEEKKQTEKKWINFNRPGKKWTKKEYPEKTASGKKIIVAFDINQADTATLKQIKGIGPVLSTRIVKYRDLLGGFTSKQQLKEVYGLKEEALHNLDSLSFISSDFQPIQLNINELEAYKLDDHPYISKKIASAIDAFKFQHGKIDSVGTLYKIHLLDTATIRRIYPYLKF